MTTRLEQIKARLEAATPGPWEASGDGVYKYDDNGICHPVAVASIDSHNNINDAMFLANAPDDLAALLRIAEAAERWEEAKATHKGITECSELLTAAVRAFQEGAE